MRTVHYLSLAVFAAALANCAQGEKQDAPVGDSNDIATSSLASAALSDAGGNPIGTVTLIRDGASLSLHISIAGLEPGQRAFHLHTTGLCEGPDFKSAGGHLNPYGKAHGRLNQNGKHLGDLPNVLVSENGTFDQTFALEGEAAELLPAIFDEDGAAVMIHAGPDDYATDPAGAAGPRIACGVLKRTD